MKLRLNKTLLAMCTGAAIFSVPFSSYAAPAIKSVTTSSSVESQENMVVVSGSGFGTKKQAAPILFDMVDRVYENGKENVYASNLADGYQLVPTNSSPEAVWWKPSSNVGDAVHPAVNRT